MVLDVLNIYRLHKIAQHLQQLWEIAINLLHELGQTIPQYLRYYRGLKEPFIKNIFPENIHPKPEKQWSNRRIYNLVLFFCKQIKNLVIFKENIPDLHTSQLYHCVLIYEPEGLPEKADRKKNLSNISAHNLQYLLISNFPFLIAFWCFLLLWKPNQQLYTNQDTWDIFFKDLQGIHALQDRVEPELD